MGMHIERVTSRSAGNFLIVDVHKVVFRRSRKNIPAECRNVE